jgi:hypothetical protein
LRSNEGEQSPTARPIHLATEIQVRKTRDQVDRLRQPDEISAEPISEGRSNEMNAQTEFFPDLPRKANPRRAYAEVRVDRNILPFPVSVWKGGRMRGDLSAYDAGEVVSRNADFFWKEVVRRLRERFNADIVELVNANIAEVVSEVSQELTHPGKLGALPTAEIAQEGLGSRAEREDVRESVRGESSSALRKIS